MKVQEKGSDRRAEVYLQVRGIVDHLQEYGQYVDPADKAICCYVPVEEGNVIRVTGKFTGTTLSVSNDTFVDGVLRKSVNFVGQKVTFQKSRRLDCDTVLCQTGNDDCDGDGDGDGDGKRLIDTAMKVTPVSQVIFIQGDGSETIGTVEVRLYVLRTFGVEHSLGDVDTYLGQDDTEDGDEDDKNEDKKKEAIYKKIQPDFMMGFETNCPDLSTAEANRWNKRLKAKRPGKEPWAIFRFHYRSKEYIEAEDMENTHDPKWKGKGGETHTLDLEPAPGLSVGPKPAKLDDSRSARGLSATPASQTRPSTPMSPLLQKRLPVDEEDVPKQSVSSDDTVRQESVEKSEDKPNDASEVTAANSELDAAKTMLKMSDAPETTKPTEEAPAPVPKVTTTIPTTPVLPTQKRPAPPTTPSTTPDAKRSKPMTLMETRKQLKLAKNRREAVAEQRAKLEEQLAPFKAAMAAEQERLSKELEGEKQALREEAQALKDDLAMLNKFKKEDKNE